MFTGGFYITDNSSYLLLGSSLGAWKHGEFLSKEIYILNDITKMIYTSPRILNQYNRRNSHKPWGFYSARSFAKGYTPILPISFINHHSQRKKNITTAHLASKILYAITAPQIITENDLIDLFLFFAGSTVFINTCKNKQRIAINFTEYLQILQFWI